MVSNDLEHTQIMLGKHGVYIAKENEDGTISPIIRREITHQEMMAIIYWFASHNISVQGGRYEIRRNGEKVLTIIKNK